jgi:UDP-glucose 4-epimerase
MTQHILITGVAGFLGSHLADALLKGGHRVTGVDNLSMGSRENLQGAMTHPAFTFHELDILNQAEFEAAIPAVDAVVHMAASKIPRYSSRLGTLRINSQGSEHALEVARHRNARFILASTSDVYGKSPHIPFREDQDTVLGSSSIGRWSYATSKLFDEHLAWGYQEEYDLGVTIIRIFGSYGPRQHRSWWGGPQSVFIDTLLRGQPIPIHGDGQQTRSFTYVQDTVAGFVAAVEKPEAVGQLFNIGDDREISILDLAHLLHRLMGKPGEAAVQLIPYQEIADRPYEDVRRRVPDNRKARQILAFSPQTSLEDGLSQTIAWQSQFYPLEVL